MVPRVRENSEVVIKFTQFHPVLTGFHSGIETPAAPCCFQAASRGFHITQILNGGLLVTYTLMNMPNITTVVMLTTFTQGFVSQSFWIFMADRRSCREHENEQVAQ